MISPPVRVNQRMPPPPANRLRPGTGVFAGQNPGAAMAPPPVPDTDAQNLLRKIGFWCTLCLVFLRYSLFHEFLTVSGGSNGKILYIFSIPALLCMLLSGGIRRLFSSRASFY